METQETGGLIFKIKKRAWHYKLISSHDFSLEFESQHISLCKYFWKFIVSLMKLAIVIAVALPLMMAWGLFCIVFLLGRPEIICHDIRIKYYKPWGGWFYPSFIPLSAINVAFWKYFTGHDIDSFSLFMQLVTVLAGLISVFSALVLAYVIVVAVLCFFEDTSTGRMIWAYFKARRAKVCPILEIEE